MRLKQVDIFYSENNTFFFSELLKPIQEVFNQSQFDGWCVSREWVHGPHFRLLLDTENYFYSEALLGKAIALIGAFLERHPSSDPEVGEYRQKQRKLMAIEKVAMDPDRVDENNKYRVTDSCLSELSGRYENPQQWISIFSANCQLRSFIIDMGESKEQSHQEKLFSIMMLLALVYKPKISDESEFGEFNGFLSYYSNYTFWHHSLPEATRQNISQTFEERYLQDYKYFENWSDSLLRRLKNCDSSLGRFVPWLKAQFQSFTQMAVDKTIHYRSPYPIEQLADISNVSDFHRKYFYTESGQGSVFPTDFSSYRWLLNIVYRMLPTLNYTPLDRQYHNYSLSRFEVERRPFIYALRESLYRF
ncbi:hypothetical protein [Rheinheimera sp. NSM]|uniref:hypothetical protein n=1 Tax=Rheinheimera sp. NSM TaxID=3457884 RepID=UPI004035392D